MGIGRIRLRQRRNVHHAITNLKLRVAESSLGHAPEGGHLPALLQSALLPTRPRAGALGAATGSLAGPGTFPAPHSFGTPVCSSQLGNFRNVHSDLFYPASLTPRKRSMSSRVSSEVRPRRVARTTF